MADFQRGVVKKITFEIEYPDGSQKTLVLDDFRGLSFIAFDAASVREGDLAQFEVSETDWTQNPAMMVYDRAEDGPGVEGIPFCTHNGCKGHG